MVSKKFSEDVREGMPKATPWGSKELGDESAAAFWADPYADLSKPKVVGAPIMGAEGQKQVIPWGAPGSGGTREEIKAALESDPYKDWFGKPKEGAPTGDIILSKGPKASPSYDPSFGLSGGGVVPGHTVQTASKGQIAEQTRIDKEAEDIQRRANEAAARTGEVAAQEKIGLAGLIEGQRIEAEKREAQRQSILNQHMEVQNQMMDDIRSSKIDPNRIFSDAGVGGFKKITAIIGIALGGFAQGLRGGPNTALDIINATIDRDIDAQKSELEKKKGLLGEQRNLYSQKLQQFGDARAAEAASKSDMLAAAQALAEGHLADAKTDEERARGEQVVNGLQSSRASHDRAFNHYEGPKAAAADPRLAKIGELAAKFMEKGSDPDTARKQAAAVLGVIPSAGIPGLNNDEDLNKAAQALIAKGADPAQARQLAAAGQGKIAATGVEALKPGGGGKYSHLPSSQQTQISKAKNVVRILDEEIALRKGEGKYAKMSDADKRALSEKNKLALSNDIVAYQTGGVPDAKSKEEKLQDLPAAKRTIRSGLSAINPFAGDPIKQLEYERQLALDAIEGIEQTAAQSLPAPTRDE